MGKSYLTVLLSGKQASGKSTLAEGLISAINFRRRDTIAKTFRLYGPIEEIHDFALGVLDKHKFPHITPDKALLKSVDNWGRESVDPDVWTYCLNRSISTWFDSTPNDVSKIAIVEDVKTKREFEKIPSEIKIRLECARAIRQQRAPGSKDMDCGPSDLELDDYVMNRKFDLTLDSGVLDKTQMVSAVYDFLEKRAFLR